MTYDDLPHQPKPGVLLYCPECQSEYSATRGDYFASDGELDPCTCGGTLSLREKTVALLFISTADAEKEPHP